MAIILERFKSFAFEFQNFLFRFLLKVNLSIRNTEEVIFLGNAYSGYWFPKSLTGSRGIIWGVGLGHDSSFELELINLGYDFIGFEPESKCFASSKKQFAGTKAIIENYGLWDKAGKFHYTGTNISIVDIFDIGKKSEELLDIRSLWDECDLRNTTYQSKPRILKLNIEGAEREILLKFIEEPLDFDVIIFQAEFLFHLGFKRVGKKVLAYKELLRILRTLKIESWKIAHFSRHQITLLRDVSH
jgi:FkbM family methyltransferase